MQQQIKKYQKKLAQQLTRFGDIRFTGQVIFVVIVLLITWSGIRAIESNYSLQQQVGELRQQNEVADLQNTTIGLQNQYYKSNQYLELTARQDFGLALPGETELLVPQNVALSYTVTPPNFAGTTPVEKTSKGQIDYQTWVDFFLHRQ